MKKIKTIVISALVAVFAVCLSFAFVGCGDKDEQSSSYGYGEQGVYYCEDGSSTYMLSLQGGTFMISLNGDTYGGNYSYGGNGSEMVFTYEGNDAKGDFGEDFLSITVDGYTFLAYKFFDVTFVDGEGGTVYVESVLYGKCADAFPGDEYDDDLYFLGWYETAAIGTEFDFDNPIVADTVVYGYFMSKDPAAAEYVVTLDYGDGVSETVVTMNSAIWKGLPSSHRERDIYGWWVSATNRSGEPTYKYNEGTALDADTTLFAVYEEDVVVGASVTKSGVTWESSASVTITVYDADGGTVFTDSASGGTYTSDDFVSLETGEYSVEIQSAGKKETLKYIVNALPRVSRSSFSVIVNGSGRIISFAAVQNATGYEITVNDGTKEVTESLGSRTYYNFSDWEMTKEGLTFTVRAYADGYVSSESEKYTYLMALGNVELKVSDDAVSWSRVGDALVYMVTVTGEDGSAETFSTSETSFSLKYCVAGKYTVTVQPVTDGYYSESTTIEYTKTTLAAPEITDMSSYSVTWSDVGGADYYVVVVNGETYTVIDATTLDFGDAGVETDLYSYEVCVKACVNGGDESPYSDAETATAGEFDSVLSYRNGVIYWNYNISAVRYTVYVNGATKTYNVTSGNRCDIEFTRSGDNEIKVVAYDSDGESIGEVTTKVYAYTITLYEDAAATSGRVVYVAQGDILKLGTPTKSDSVFSGWYTQPDYTDGGSAGYAGKGSLVSDGTVFTGSRDLYLYAYWTYDSI